MKTLFRALWFTVVCIPLASCETFDFMKQNRILITTHLQSDAIEHPAEIMTLPINGQDMRFKKIPEFSQRSISGFESFPAEDGQGYGVLVQLDTKGRNALEMATRMNTGMVLLTMVNALPVDMVEIDKPVTDGRFTIWRGLSKETIDEMDKFYPRIKYMKSSSRWMEMTPSTESEKLKARRAGKEAEAAEKKAKLDKERGIVPKAPKTKDIPLEGFKLPGT